MKTLEPPGIDEQALTFDVAQLPEEIVRAVLASVAQAPPAPQVPDSPHPTKAG